MTSPQIKILISLAGISLVYAFVCEIRLSQKARQLAEWVKNVRPELWAELNVVARNWNGGHPGLKLLYRKRVIDLPKFDREYKQVQALERKLLWGIGIGVGCLCLLFLGLRFLGWHW